MHSCHSPHRLAAAGSDSQALQPALSVCSTVASAEDQIRDLRTQLEQAKLQVGVATGWGTGVLLLTTAVSL
jgi:hypothetical protein